MKQKEFLLGVSAMLPLLLGVAPFGLVFGVLGISSGLSETETILMSSIIFAGASQVVFAQLWAAGSAFIVIGSSVALINFCLLYTSPSPRDQRGSRMPSSA